MKATTHIALLLGLLSASQAIAGKTCIAVRGTWNSSLNYGAVEVGDDSTRSVKIVNRCSSAQLVSLVVTGAGFHSGLAGTAISLPAHKRTTLSVRFAPDSAGSFLGALNVTHVKLQVFALNGTGFGGEATAGDNSGSDSTAVDSSLLDALPSDETIYEDVPIDSLIVTDTSGASDSLSQVGSSGGTGTESGASGPVSIRKFGGSADVGSLRLRSFDLLGRQVLQ